MRRRSSWALRIVHWRNSQIASLSGRKLQLWSDVDVPVTSPHWKW